ncbi:nucleotide-binding protein [Paenibacillus sp. GYB003]|uniref:nucleotide-binding protein n=1 Tax=Paenibacillus sp. GYB003 TaxID=2994392 RepID=UPI002F961037
MPDKLELVVADRDARYLKLLADYIRDTEWSRKLAVRQITRPESLREYAESRQARLYVIHDDFGPAETNGGIRFRLCETKRSAEERDGIAPGLYKYQPLHQLLGRMLELYRGQAVRERGREGGAAAAVYAVYSAAGGVGKTTVSLHLARTLAERGDRCLYWNMELAPGSVLPNETDADLAARFIYGLRAGAPWTAECLPGLIFRAEPHGFDYFPGIRRIRETFELTADDVGKLAGCLKRTGTYDAIVFDLDGSLHERTLGALSQSDAIAWIVTEDGESAARSFKLLAEMERLSGEASAPELRRIRFVLNKHSGSSANSLWTSGAAAPPTVRIAVKLPYVAAWKQLHGGASKPLAEPMFAEAVAKLADVLRPSEGGEAGVGRSDYPYAARTNP